MKVKSLFAALFVSALSFIFITLSAPGFAEDDDQYIQDDHYFIASEKFTQGYISVSLATMKTPATVETKNEAEFTKINSGEDVWTKFYYKTRILKKEEIKKGLEVIIFEGRNDDGVYCAPENKDEALNNSWFMAKITDLSDMYKGYVTVSGGYKVKIDNMRIAVKSK